MDLSTTLPSPATELNVPAAGEPKSWRHLKIRGALGGGAFGTVFRAWEPRLEREVALKLLHHLDPAAEDAVVEEASLLARVHHPNVVAILGADRSEGCAGLWMELINGRTLKEIQDQSGPCSAEEATVYGLDVCRALAAVHLAGLVHRDVKAQNVMREAGGRVVLMDFGAAATGTGSGTTIRGTPFYLAPEVLQGEAPTVQSDLYSLGVLLFYLVSGDFPVLGNSLDSLREEHRHGRRRLLRDLRPDLPAAFVRMVDAALSARREERPATAGAMEALLESTLGRDSVASRAGSGAAPQPSGRAQQSVAVLRFVNMTVDKNLEFFCDGVAEEIINALTTVPGLRVMPAASAFRFTSGAADLREVGARLDVGTVLEGSVRVSGDRIRVISRLISTADGSQLWSQRFERPLGEIFDIQDEIATATVNAIGVRLVRDQGRGAMDAGLMRAEDGNASRPIASRTRDAEAYTLYLKGRHCWNQRTEGGLHKSAAYFEKAVARDPEYADGYAGLAEAYTTLGLYGVLAPHETMPKGRAAAHRAIALGSSQASPYATAGCIASVYDWLWPDAERQYLRAIDLSPQQPVAHHWYAINYLVPRQRFAEADKELRYAVDADPLSMPIHISVGLTSYFARDYLKAEQQFNGSFELDPASAPARLFLGLTLVEIGRFDEAVRELETAIQLAGSPEMIAARGYAFARAGASARAREALGALITMSGNRYVSASLVAQVHAALGEPTPALDWLERAADAHAADLAWLRVRPVFDTLRGEARFGAILERVAP